jgi:hypothetical protein
MRQKDISGGSQQIRKLTLIALLWKVLVLWHSTWWRKNIFRKIIMIFGIITWHISELSYNFDLFFSKSPYGRCLAWPHPLLRTKIWEIVDWIHPTENENQWCAIVDAEFLVQTPLRDPSCLRLAALPEKQTVRCPRRDLQCDDFDLKRHCSATDSIVK